MKKTIAILCCLILLLAANQKTQAQTLVSAVVKSPVSADNSAVWLEKNKITVRIKDKNSLLLSKRISLKGTAAEDKYSQNGLAEFAISRQISRFFDVYADREIYLGSFGVLAKPPLFPFLFSQAKAAENQEITIAPATINKKIIAGESTDEKVYFTNGSGEKQNFEAFLTDYAALNLDKNNIQFLPFSTQADSLKGIIEFDPKRFDLEANAIQEINIRFSPDKNIASGKYKGALFVGKINPSGENTNGVQLSVAGRVGTLIGTEILQKQNKLSLPLKTVTQHPVRTAGVLVLIIFSLILLIIKYRRRMKNL